jgi:hypothetical protein
MDVDLKKAIDDLNKKYKNVRVLDASYNKDGSASLKLEVNKDSADAAISNFKLAGVQVSEIEDTSPVLNYRKEYSSILTRDAINPSYLDLPVTPSILDVSKPALYKRAINYYREEDVYGSSIDLLANLAYSGFHNDIDDPDIKNFYENWVADVEFPTIVEQIFFDFFRVGLIRTYKIVGDYLPKVNFVSPIPGQAPVKISPTGSKTKKNNKAKATLAEKSVPAGAKIPVKYTILNPTMLELESALFSDSEAVYLSAEAVKPLKDLMEAKGSEITVQQKELIKKLPSKFKSAIKSGGKILLESEFVGSIDYRKQPYETYPFPRGSRAFTALEYKRDLRRADISTLDGITNSILLITVGNDKLPVKTQDTLDTVAALFNTPSKSFDVVWNHTLKIEKIVSPEIGSILGQEKYKQVNEDITGALGVIRAVIDGVGNYNAKAVELAVVGLQAEVAYARRKVSEWIHKEYRSVAEAVGFSRYPRVKFNEMALKNEAAMMNIVQGLIDRRIISYETGHKMLQLDYPLELAQLQEEKPLVLAGDLGILGSPYQKSANPGSSAPTVQQTPEGTPSEGRPTNKPTKTPAPAKKPRTKVKKDSEKSGLEKDLTTLTKEELLELATNMSSLLEAFRTELENR